MLSITAEEWPRLAAAYEAWLDPTNHDGGRQARSLADPRRSPEVS